MDEKDSLISETPAAAYICCICLDKDGKKELKSLLCKHVFHKECIADWLKEHLSCPICRRKMASRKDIPPSLEDVPYLGRNARITDMSFNNKQKPSVFGAKKVAKTKGNKDKRPIKNQAAASQDKKPKKSTKEAGVKKPSATPSAKPSAKSSAKSSAKPSAKASKK